MSPPPFRADQVGSLIRPKYLLDANAASKQWLESEKDRREEADDAGIKRRAKEAEQKAIAEVVAEQVKRGIAPISSGEFERPIFFGGFFEAIDGLELKFCDLSKFRTDFPTNVSDIVLLCLLVVSGEYPQAINHGKSP
jgi:methionine synthase II (cobalamin-independent)